MEPRVYGIGESAGTIVNFTINEKIRSNLDYAQIRKALIEP
jgi:hypothetical protein